MFKKTNELASALGIILSIGASADIIHSKWVGGVKGLWDEPSNWEPSVVPDNQWGNNFIVTIDSNNVEVDKVIYIYSKTK